MSKIVHDVPPAKRSSQAQTVKLPLWTRCAVLCAAIFLTSGATAALGQTPTPSPSPALSPSPSPSPQPGCNVVATASVTISGGGGSFNPFSLTIDAGTQVTWTNVGNSRARVRDVDHTFLDSDDLQPGQSFSFTFSAAGEYPYLCKLHPTMTAVVIVTADAYIPPE